MATLCDQAAHLADLTLDFDTPGHVSSHRYESLESQFYHGILAYFDKCPLQKLRMMCFCADNANVPTLLLKHASTLRILDIDYAKVETRGDAFDLLGFIEESNPQLDHLGFERLMIVQGRRNEGWQTYGTIWSAQYDGTETIKQALAEVAERPEIVVGGPREDLPWP